LAMRCCGCPGSLFTGFRRSGCGGVRSGHQQSGNGSCGYELSSSQVLYLLSQVFSISTIIVRETKPEQVGRKFRSRSSNAAKNAPVLDEGTPDQERKRFLRIIVFAKMYFLLSPC